MNSIEKFYSDLFKMPKFYAGIIALVAAIFSGYYAAQIVDITLPAMVSSSPEAAKGMGMAKTITYITGPLVTLITILIMALVYFGVTLLFNRNATYAKCLEITAYSMIFTIISNIIMIYMLSNTDTSWITSMQDVTTFQKDITKWGISLMPITIISALFVAGGLKYAFSIEWWQALLAACVPVIFSLASTLLN